MSPADLFEAIASGDVAAVRAALAGGASPDATRVYRTAIDRDIHEGTQSALMLAVIVGQPAIVVALLAAGATPGLADELTLRTPLVEAAAQGQTEIVRCLLAAGATADARALTEVVRLGREDLAELMVDSGVDPNGSGALAAAATCGRVGMVRWLVAHGVDVAASGPEALHNAANAGQAEATKALLALGVPIEARTGYGWTPLHLAAYNGNADTVAALLEAGADPGADDGTGKTALDWARARGKADSAALLDAAVRPAGSSGQR